MMSRKKMINPKNRVKLVGVIFLMGILILNLSLTFNSSTVSAAFPDNDLKLWYNYMAGTNFSGDPNDLGESFYKALPLGNGRVGAMVYGNYPDERIDLNECTFWSSGPSNNNKSGAANSLATAQNQLFSGQYKTAETTINNMIGGGEARYQSVGDLKLAFGHSSVSGYSRQLDMNTGIVSCDYTYNGKTYHRESFVSYPDEVLVTRITCGSTGSISFTASYECSLSGQYTISTAGSDTLIMNGHGDSDNGVNYAVWFSTRTKIINTNGTVAVSGSTLKVTNADSVVILTSVRTNFVNYATCNGDEKGKATTDITNASAKSYTTLYNNHVADYQALFQRVDIDLGGSGSENSKPMNTRISQFGSTNDPKLVKVLFQYGRYLMITASRNSEPMNLQGIWNKFRNPAWGCKMTTNINYEMNYWPAMTTNLAECFTPFVNKAKALQTRGNETARAHYNISNGWVLHHNTDLWNRCAPIDGAWGFWPTGAGWICNMVYDAYNFNQDTNYLNDVYPTIKGAADFLQTLMKAQSINGQSYQVICPGTSPELTPPSASGGQGAWCSYGVTMDNQICRELFRGVINASTILNVDSSFRSTLQSKLGAIKPDTVGSWGQLQEWAYDWDSQTEQNRHISFAYSLFPGQEISKRKTSSLANAVIKSLNARGDVGTGWSEGWKLNCWARLEDGAHAYNLIKLMITPAGSSGRLYDNLWDAHPPFQIDGNFGFTSGVTEMLLQSHNNEIQFLPALPSQWSTGHANGLRARGNFTITQMNWANGALTSVYIKSNSGKVCNVRYGNTTNSFATTAGVTYQLNNSLQLVGSGTSTPTIPPATPTPTPTPIPGTISIAAGSSSAVGSFQADQYYSGGSAYNNTNTVDVSQITSNPPPAALFNNERYGAMSYTIPGFTVGNSYTVTLYFAETYLTSSGSRIFNVSINGATALANFDIYASAGGQNKAIARSFTATANSSGQIVIQFTSGTENPKINGISIKPGSGTPTPTPTRGVVTATPTATPLPTVTTTQTPTPTSSVTTTPTPTTGSGAISIAAGRTSALGNFQADQYYSGGSTYSNTNTVDVSQITSNPPPAALFNNERYGAMSYTIPGFTPGSSYTVTLYFAETYLTASGSRLFNVSINGATALSNFDIYASAGGQNKAIARSFTATANSSGQIVIQFISGTENPKINGISIK